MQQLNTGGIVLCGGQSSRMGQPKAWLPIAGEIMLQRVVRLLRAVVSPVVVVAAPAQEVPALPVDIDIVHDEHLGRGPLQGLAAGLTALQGRAHAAYLSSCDVPFLRPAFVQRLIQLRGDAAICVARVGEHHHPLAAVYRVDVLDAVQQLLLEERLRLSSLFDALPTRVVGPDELADVDPMFESLRNLNTPEEYRQAVRELSSDERSA